jgi:hypothetical protein
LITRRTKVVLWLSTLPSIIVAGGAAWVAIYPFYLKLKGGAQASTFIAFHLHLFRLLGVTILLLTCGLISLLFDRRINGTK